MARHVSDITRKGYGKGRPSRNKGKVFDPTTYTPEEVQALLDGCNVGLSGLRDRALIVFLYRTGARVSEACNIRVGDLDLERRFVRIRGTKTRQANRVVGLDEMAVAHLRDWLDLRHRKAGQPATSGYVFCCISRHERGNVVKPAQVRQKLHRLAEKAGIQKRVHPHGLRHSFAAEMATERADYRLISRALGHSNVATTDRYINHIHPAEVIDYMGSRTWREAA